MQLDIVGKTFKHYKGGTYRVLHLAKHTETGEELVICLNLEHNTIWARPSSMWFDRITESTRRFKMIKEEELTIEVSNRIGHIDVNRCAELVRQADELEKHRKLKIRNTNHQGFLNK